MNRHIGSPEGQARLAAGYRRTLLDDVVPFWMRHGFDREHGGFITGLDRDGTIVDTDKPVWAQGRGAWLLATLFNTVERRAEWLDAAESALGFLRRHAFAGNGKMYFLLARDGRPLRMRRYVFSEAFASIAFAAHARAADCGESADEAIRLFARYVDFSFTPGMIPPKSLPENRPSKALAPLMIAVATAQEVRENLGDVAVAGVSCSDRIAAWIDEIERDFFKPEIGALMEVVDLSGNLIDHFDGRTMNPGHAIEAAWFILREAARRDDRRLVRLGCAILDAMWRRGWDAECGGLFYFRDVRGLPVQEYWHDMKFWWPHCEAIIATALAWRLTGDPLHAERHAQVHDWAFENFGDPEFGEWFGYLHRDGSRSSTLKGNHWKGPFHLPRMLWYGSRILNPDLAVPG